MAAGNSVGRAKIDGSAPNPSFLPASDPTGLATDGTHLYWSNFAAPNASGGGTAIGRANVDGSGINQAFISGASSPTSIAVTAGSAAPVRCAVPRVVGKQINAARTAIAKAHCAVGKVTQDGQGRNRPGALTVVEARPERLREVSPILPAISPRG